MALKEKAEAKAKEYQVNDVCKVWNNGCPNVYYASMQMFEWTKEEMIDKVCEWMLCHLGFIVTYCEDDIVEQVSTEDMIKKFRREMEG